MATISLMIALGGRRLNNEGEEAAVRVALIRLVALGGLAMTSLLNNGRARSSPAQPSSAPASGPFRGADLVLLRGKIWTGEEVATRGPRSGFAREVEAVAIVAGRILAAGATDEIQAYIGDQTHVIDLEGRRAVPGFIDSHVHFLAGGIQLLEIDLKDARDEADFTRRIREKAKTLAPGRWILGGEWDEQAWPSAKLPTRWLIDSVTSQNPVFIRRYDGHAALANSLALKLAQVRKATQEPAGGLIVRDTTSGEPTGVLKDAAMDLVEKVIPKPGETQLEEALKGALAEARRVGVTSIQNITLDTELPSGNFTDEIRLLRRAEREGWLTARFYEIVPIAHWKCLEEDGIIRGAESDFLKLGAVKAFADGSLGSATAWMFQPFNDDPGNQGLPTRLMSPPQEMESLARSADKAQIQLAIHAIGDRAVREVLDLFARLGGDGSAAHRFRIEHAQHIRPEDFARFGKLGVIASMQPYHAIDDGRWAEKRLGHERSRTSYAWRSILKAGAPLAFGSDWPVAPLNPLLGIYAAVTRATLDGKHPNGWFPEERLTVEEALRAYTQGSAFAAFEENEKGKISPGKLADLVALSDDLFTIPPEKIRDVRVIITIVGGKVVYQAE